MSDVDRVSNPSSAPRVPDLRTMLARRAVSAIYQPRAAPITFPHADERLIFEELARPYADKPITYLEFGVANGRSMRRMIGWCRHPDARFIGFDSFRGLPEGWGTMAPGHFGKGGNRPDITDPRVRFVRGWFQNTVPEFLATTRLEPPVRVHFDADLYSSTLFLLASLWPIVPEYSFTFDEFLPDEVTALHDFMAAFPVEIEFTHAAVDSVGRARRVAGTMKRIEMVVEA